MLLVRTYGRKVAVLFRITVMVLTGKTVLFVRAGGWKVDGPFKNTLIALAGKTTLLVRIDGYKVDVCFTYSDSLDSENNGIGTYGGTRPFVCKRSSACCGASQEQIRALVFDDVRFVSTQEGWGF